ncbi:zinc-binding dehydrogenase [Pseudoalteromonas sp. T1lg76]|uniref:zinc-binding dehydrogenase n=1 Tax=Pseudoalteromonas sp. T1lg76 TaxID=2077103 RepID=UPI000CF69074|nr:zinc-binding dehydrogenase [Pseudoalteromonas sp. T1lg76]
MNTMKAAMYTNTGHPAEVLDAREIAIPEPQAGEIRVRMTRSPIHNHDIMTVRGEYGSLPELPAIGGSEAVGIVDALGEGVVGPVVGTRVNVAGVAGTWAEYFIAPAMAAVPLPDSISDDIAAQLLAMPMSSVMALNKIPAKTGDWIVVNAANGAVGKTVAQIAKGRGLKVLSLVNRGSSKAQLDKLGIGNVFAMDEANWFESALAAIDGPVVGGIEMIGGEAARKLINLVGNGGTVLSFGAMSNEPMAVDAADLIFKEITVKGFWGMVEFSRLTPEQITDSVLELIGLAEQGELTLPVHETFAIKDIAKAGATYDQPRQGKLMIQP